MSTFQYVYRKNTSTLDAFTILKEVVHKYIAILLLTFCSDQTLVEPEVFLGGWLENLTKILVYRERKNEPATQFYELTCG